MKKLIFIGLCLGFIFAAADSASAQFCKPNANQIAIFVDANFQGHCKILNAGEYPNAKSFGLPNDSVSSIMAGANVYVALCPDDDFNGDCMVFEGNIEFLGDTMIGNDTVSSIKFTLNNAAGKVVPAPVQLAPQPAAQPLNLPPPTDETIYPFKMQANVSNCTPNPGWAKCIQMAEPTIRIMATKAVSQSAMNGVANVYSEMMRRLGPKYQKSKLDTFIVYMSNAEPWSELINLAPIGMAYPQTPYERSGDNLRGYGNPDNLWISETLICKTGIQTRRIPDTQYRSFDQVIHEFGHSLHSNYLTDQFVDSTFKFDKMTPLESFPYRIQQWFRVPNLDVVPISPKEDSFMKGFFTARATFSCDGYKP